jgi:hypothetical protein
MNQIRTIDDIFEKGTGRDYTDDALLYQDILAYSTIIKMSSSENVSFKFTELANWLLEIIQNFSHIMIAVLQEEIRHTMPGYMHNESVSKIK